MGPCSRLLGVTCWCLLLIFPVCTMTAEVTPAVVWGTGVIKVNGKVVPGSFTVYAGDKIVTEVDSTATLTGRFGTAMLPASSAIVYAGGKIQMQYGQAVVIAQPGAEAQLGNLKIAPERRPRASR